MRKIFAAILNLISRSIAAVLGVLAVLATILVFLLLGVKHTLLDAATYKRALVENHVYEQLPALFADQFSAFKTFLADPCAGNLLGCTIDGASPELQACLINALGGERAYEQIGTGQRKATEAELNSTGPCIDQYGDPASLPGAGGQSPESSADQGGGQMSYLNNFTSEQWGQLISLLLPPEDLQPMTESALDQLFDYFNGRADSANISMVKLKARLSGQDLILSILNSQPPCTQEQVEQINAVAFGSKEGTAILCAAPGGTSDKLVFELQSRIKAATSTIPDEAPLVKPASASDPASGRGPLGTDPQAALKMINTAILFSPLLPLALLFLTGLFGARSVKGWLRWCGIPLFIAGLIPLSAGIAALPVFEWGWVRYAVPRFPTMLSTSSLIALGHGLAHSVARDLAAWIMLETGLITLLALGAILGSYYVRPRPKQSARPVVSPASPGSEIV